MKPNKLCVWSFQPVLQSRKVILVPFLSHYFIHMVEAVRLVELKRLSYVRFSSKKKEHEPKLLGPDIFWWVWGSST